MLRGKIRFNPRPCMRGDTHLPSICLYSEFQSTPPHGGRPHGGTHHGGGARVSIHTPTRGATRRCSPYSIGPAVSIHAPTRGATGTPGTITTTDPFQSTPPHGGATAVRTLRQLHHYVSIHAPTRGATRACM